MNIKYTKYSKANNRFIITYSPADDGEIYYLVDQHKEKNEQKIETYIMPKGAYEKYAKNKEFFARVDALNKAHEDDMLYLAELKRLLDEL